MLYCFPQYISYFILLPSMFYSFPSMPPCFLACFIALMMLAHPSWARICLNTLFVLRSTCLGAFYHVFVQIYMFRCFFPCLCLDLYAQVLFSIVCVQIYMSICFWPCSCAPCHVYVQIYVFMCSLPCLCVQIYMLDAMPSAFIAFYLLLCIFLVFWPLSRVQIQILRSRLTSIHACIKGFGSFLLWMCMLACLLLCFTSMFVWQDLGFCCALSPSQACACQSLGPLACVVVSIPLIVCLDATIYEIHLHDVGLLNAYLSLLHAMLCLTCLLCALIWISLFLCIFASLHTCLHVHA